MKGEALKGHLEMLLLAAVGARSAHGYAIIEELRRRSGGAFDLPEGTVYPALHRLERAGLLGSEWAEASGRRRRVYRLTPGGRAALAEREQEWSRFADGVAGVLRGATT
jgi:PadR family transcriptional regulator PadR